MAAARTRAKVVATGSTSVTMTNGHGPEMELALVAIAEIVPATDNLRRNLDDVDGLAASIQAVGIIEPLVVERCVHSTAHGYHLVAGHRRRAAALKAGLDVAPCLIRPPVEERERVSMFLIENLQRRDLDPLDEADGYRRLVALGRTQREIAEAVGFSQAHVSKRLALLELPAELQARVRKGPGEKGAITLEDAVALTRLKGHPKELAAAAKGGDVRWAVERAELTLKAKAAGEKLVEVAKAKGWKIVDRVEYPKRPAYRELRGRNAGYIDANRELQLDAAEHRSEPCHAALRPSDSWQTPKALTEVCIDPARHRKGGLSPVKLAPKPKRQIPEWELKEQKVKALLKEATDARRPFVVEALARIPAGAPKDPVVAMALHSLVEHLAYDKIDLACQLLGLPAELPGISRQFELQVAATNNLTRAAAACCAALAESWLGRGNFDADSRRHYEWLKANGYELTEWDRQLWDDAERG